MGLSHSRQDARTCRTQDTVSEHSEVVQAPSSTSGGPEGSRWGGLQMKVVARAKKRGFQYTHLLGPRVSEEIKEEGEEKKNRPTRFGSKSEILTHVTYDCCFQCLREIYFAVIQSFQSPHNRPFIWMKLTELCLCNFIWQSGLLKFWRVCDALAKKRKKKTGKVTCGQKQKPKRDAYGYYVTLVTCLQHMQRLWMTKNLVPSKASKHKPRQLHVQNKLLFVYAIISASFYFCTLICSLINTVQAQQKIFDGQKPQSQWVFLRVLGLYLKTASSANSDWYVVNKVISNLTKSK